MTKQKERKWKKELKQFLDEVDKDKEEREGLFEKYYRFFKTSGKIPSEWTFGDFITHYIIGRVIQKGG